MKIIQGLDSWYPDVCGPVIVVDNYSRIMQERGNDVSLVVPKFSLKQRRQVVKEFSYPIYTCPSTPIPEGMRCAFPFLSSKLPKVMKNADILHCHSPFGVGDYFTNFGKLYKIPSVLTFHTKFKDEFLRITKSKMLASAMTQKIVSSFKNADCVLTVSKGAAETLKEYGFSRHIEVVRNGTDMTPAIGGNALIEKLNEEYNLGSEKNVLLFVGRIVAVKHIDLVIKALAEVKKRGVPFKFMVVGDGEEKKNLEELASSLGIAEDVLFVGLIRDREYLKGFYLRADLFVFPSVFDTASLVPIEAATFSLPTLLVKGSPTSEIIENGVDGYAEIDDKDKWADKIIEILGDRNKLSAVSDRAHNDVYRTWDDTVGEVMEIYKEVIFDYER